MSLPLKSAWLLAMAWFLMILSKKLRTTKRVCRRSWYVFATRRLNQDFYGDENWHKVHETIMMRRIEARMFFEHLNNVRVAQLYAAVKAQMHLIWNNAAKLGCKPGCLLADSFPRPVGRKRGCYPMQFVANLVQGDLAQVSEHPHAVSR
jgi:hypothetical protein